jgi:hypothetical protein
MRTTLNEHLTCHINTGLHVKYHAAGAGNLYAASEGVRMKGMPRTEDVTATKRAELCYGNCASPGLSRSMLMPCILISYNGNLCTCGITGRVREYVTAVKVLSSDS